MLVASLFIGYGLNGWSVFAATLLAKAIIVVLVNLAGKPSVRYGIPYLVAARAGMGVHGANLPAMIRALAAIFWYGAQAYVASTAVALALTTLFGSGPTGSWLGLTSIGWISLIFVSVFQVALFWRGIEAIRTFLNWAAPVVYLVMLTLLAIIWLRAGRDFLPEVGSLFEGGPTNTDGKV